MNEQHSEKLAQLGLHKTESTKKGGGGGGGGEDSERDEELQQVLASSAKYEQMYAQLEQQVETVLQQIEDCDETKRFLEMAIEAAEEEDVMQCEAQTKALIEQQTTARVRTERCVQQLTKLSQSANLPPARRQRINRFIGATTPTTREPLETTIVLE